MTEERSTWDEANIVELRRLAFLCGDITHDVDDLDPMTLRDDDRETLHDAKYYAGKLYLALMKLASHAVATE